jgi:chemotaxis protein methyltransferase CheR
MRTGNREFGRAQFGTVRALVEPASGLHLHDGKFSLVQARLARLLREIGVADIDAYLGDVAADRSGRELARLIDVLTTNKTSFFREPKHFELLRDRLIPELYAPGRPLRVWSAGCSSGEEAYTLAMVFDMELGTDANVRILATDISARMLARARQGLYPEESLGTVPAAPRLRYFRCVRTAGARAYEVSPRLRARVRFARLNLMDDWPMRGRFDLICCRNVMIYFDRPTRQQLVDRFWSLLAPGGYFLAGHSESFAALEHGFEYVQPAVYRRPA